MLYFGYFVYFFKVSDDEDDTHPNIDTPSLFRWRHQARVERMEEAKKERDAVETKLSEWVFYRVMCIYLGYVRKYF